jgi:hypothetical protein
MNVPPGFWEAIASWPATGLVGTGEEVMPPLQPMAGDGPHRCPQRGPLANAAPPHRKTPRPATRHPR